jgi:hypothetical protein
VKNHLYRFLILFVLITIRVIASGQNIHISSTTEKILIHEDTLFTNSVSIILKKSDQPIIYPVFYDTELEKVTDIKVYTKSRNRFKQVKNPVITEEAIDLDFITSKKVKYIKIPPNVEAKITYTISCSELMYFSDLRFFSYHEIDTIRYQIHVPEKFQFIYSITHEDLLESLTIDSVETKNMKKWFVEVVPVKAEPDLLMLFGIYRNLKVPVMRTIVVPESYKYKGKDYLNDWFLLNTETTKGLDSIALKKIDELTMGITDTLLILETIYNYVKSNFTYVSIQIGMGAFIPSHANQVFINKHGDCKDISNFLCEALNYKGIRCYLALAATYNHINDCDFPSLSSANHILCAAYINGRQFILDPTDPIHIPGKPVQSLQDRTILIIHPDGGEYYKIEAMTAQDNEINYIIELVSDSGSKSLDGAFKVRYEGISGNFLKRALKDIINDDRRLSLGKQHYETVFGNHSISIFSIDNHPDYVATKGNIHVKARMFQDNDMQILFLDFLPRLIESENREKLLDGIYVGNTINKKVNCRIIMDRMFEPFHPVKHHFSDNGVSLNLTISNPSDYIVNCEYNFILDHITVENENTEYINQILNSFKKILNEPIILKNKY